MFTLNVEFVELQAMLMVQKRLDLNLRQQPFSQLFAHLLNIDILHSIERPRLYMLPQTHIPETPLA